MIADRQTPWDLIKEQLSKKLSAESYHNWILRVRFAGIEDKVLTVMAPDEGTVMFLEDEYQTLVNGIAKSLAIGIERVAFVVDESRPGIARRAQELRAI